MTVLADEGLTKPLNDAAIAFAQREPGLIYRITFLPAQQLLAVAQRGTPPELVVFRNALVPQRMRDAGFSRPRIFTRGRSNGFSDVYDVVTGPHASPDQAAFARFLLSDDAQSLFVADGLLDRDQRVLAPNDGMLVPLNRSVDGDLVSYGMHYKYRFADGSVEEDDIPWRFVYRVGDDPFARDDTRIGFQGPPPDFVPAEPLPPLLQQMFGARFQVKVVPLSPA